MAAEIEHDEDDEEADDNIPVETSSKNTEGLWEKVVSVSVPVEEVNDEFNTVLSGLMGQVSLPGFRAGKVPRDVVERKFSGDIKKQVAANLLQQAVYAAIDQEELQPIGEPVLEAPEKITASRGQPFVFEFKTEVFPEFELPAYTNLKADQEEIEVLPEETENALNAIRERHAVEADAAADHGIGNKDSAGGVLRILVDGTEVHREDDARLVAVDGHVFGAHAHLADTFLIGAKVGEKRVVEEALQNTFPIEEHRGKKATIEFEVKSIKTLQLPPVDDELAKKVNMENVQALNDRVRSSLLEKIGDAIKERTRENLLGQIAAGVKFELPPRALQAAVRNNLQRSMEYMQQMGVSPDALGLNGEAMISRSVEASSDELRRFFILSAICDKENLNAENEEVDDVVLGMARQQNIPVQQLFDKLAEEGQIEQIETNIRFKKAIEFLTDNADITVVPRKPFSAHDHSGHDHSHDDAGHSHAEHSHSHDGEPCTHDHGELRAPEKAEHAHEHSHGGEACTHDHGAPVPAKAEHEHEHGHEHGTETPAAKK